MSRTKLTDPQMVAANQVYDVARSHADEEIARLRAELEVARAESESIGVLKKIDYDIAHNEFLRVMVLHQVKQGKEYRAGGLTWGQFCEAVGIPDRTADRMIEEVQPLIENFSAKLADLVGYPLSKIRYLGKAVSANLAEITEDGCLVYGEERIPLTPEFRDDVQALIEKIELDRRELAKTLSSTDRVLAGKEKKINEYEKRLARMEEDAADRGLTPDEDAFLQKVENLKTSFDGYLMRLEPSFETTFADYEHVTPRMRAALISGLHYMRMQILAAYDEAVNTHGDPAMNPELLEDFERWQQSQQA